MKLKYAILTLLCVLLALGIAGCLPGADTDKPSSSEPVSQEEQLPEPPAEFPVEVGGTVVASRPGKVVSLSPAITEKIFDLGLTDRLAGVSDFCADFIPDAAGSEKCGTAQQPELDVILGLGAHLVVSEIPLPEEDQKVLRDKEIDVVVIPHAQSLQELWDAYVALCRMFEGEHAGQQMGDEFVAAISGWLEEVREAAMEQEGAPKPALYLRSMSFTIATGDSLENDLMEAIGLENIAADQTGWNYPEELAKAEGRKKFESLKVMYFDESVLTMKADLEKSAFYKGLQATLKDWYLPIRYDVMERQCMASFGQLLAMAEYAWPEAEFAAWPPEIKYSLLDGSASAPASASAPEPASAPAQ